MNDEDSSRDEDENENENDLTNCKDEANQTFTIQSRNKNSTRYAYSPHFSHSIDYDRTKSFVTFERKKFEDAHKSFIQVNDQKFDKRSINDGRLSTFLQPHEMVTKEEFDKKRQLFEESSRKKSTLTPLSKDGNLFQRLSVEEQEIIVQNFLLNFTPEGSFKQKSDLKETIASEIEILNNDKRISSFSNSSLKKTRAENFMISTNTAKKQESLKIALTDPYQCESLSYQNPSILLKDIPILEKKKHQNRKVNLELFLDKKYKHNPQEDQCKTGKFKNPEAIDSHSGTICSNFEGNTQNYYNNNQQCWNLKHDNGIFHYLSMNNNNNNNNCDQEHFKTISYMNDKTLSNPTNPRMSFSGDSSSNEAKCKKKPALYKKYEPVPTEKEYPHTQLQTLNKSTIESKEQQKKGDMSSSNRYRSTSKTGSTSFNQKIPKPRNASDKERNQTPHKANSSLHTYTKSNFKPTSDMLNPLNWNNNRTIPLLDDYDDDINLKNKVLGDKSHLYVVLQKQLNKYRGYNLDLQRKSKVENPDEILYTNVADYQTINQLNHATKKAYDFQITQLKKTLMNMDRYWMSPREKKKIKSKASSYEDNDAERKIEDKMASITGYKDKDNNVSKKRVKDNLSKIDDYGIYDIKTNEQFPSVNDDNIPKLKSFLLILKELGLEYSQFYNNNVNKNEFVDDICDECFRKAEIYHSCPKGKWNFKSVFLQYPQLKSLIETLGKKLIQENKTRLQLEEKSLKIFSNDLKTIETLDQKVKKLEQRKSLMNKINTTVTGLK